MLISEACLLPWQRPNATEAYAAEQLTSQTMSPQGSFLAFPWASWIDIARDNPAPQAPLAAAPSPQAVATVAQHIEMLRHAALLRRCGITDLFWSHATRGLSHCQDLRIHPFPLYPVRCASHPNPAGGAALEGLPLAERRWLYSFQGVYRPELYLTPVRQWILDLPPRPDALLESRREWHFEQAVYREQVHGQCPDAERHSELAQEASSYARTLQQSVFALCPSGSGPNSIRLWEALGYGTIPVILAESLALPGDPALWHQAALVVPETPAAVAGLPAQLESLRADPTRLQAMQAAGRLLWQRYGLPDFTADVRGFLADPDGFLLTAARQRLGNGLSQGHLEHQATSPASLPIELRRLLRQAAPEQPLLLQIIDPAPLPLLEARWRSPLQLCGSLLGEHPWRISCRSPKLELLAAQRFATSTNTIGSSCPLTP